MTRTTRARVPLALGLALAATLSACGSETTQTNQTTQSTQATQPATSSAGSATSAASSDTTGTSAASSGTTTATGTPGTSGAGKTYPMAVFNDHDNETSCWTVINDGVYDVTAWISQHPGGPARIKGLCGQDGTSQFTGQHQGAELPMQRLASFKIGTLAK